MAGTELVRRYVGTYNSGDTAGLGVFYAEDVVLRDPMSPEPIKGREAVLAVAGAFRQAFPDMVWSLTRDAVVAERVVAWEVSARGTMAGPMPGPEGDIPATGKHFEVDMGIFWTLDDEGLIAEERAYFDATGMQAQLGLMAP